MSPGSGIWSPYKERTQQHRRGALGRDQPFRGDIPTLFVPGSLSGRTSRRLASCLSALKFFTSGICSLQPLKHDTQHTSSFQRCVYQTSHPWRCRQGPVSWDRGIFWSPVRPSPADPRFFLPKQRASLAEKAFTRACATTYYPAIAPHGPPPQPRSQSRSRSLPTGRLRNPAFLSSHLSAGYPCSAS